MVAKILGRIIIDRVRDVVDSKLRKVSQAGYGRGRETTEPVFILWNIIQQVNEWQTLEVQTVDVEIKRLSSC